MSNTAAHDDLDSPWKEVVEHAFPEFIDFYFPNINRQIDWAYGYTFLDKELQKIARDGELGRRYVDKLVRVTTLAGEEDWLCVHIEVQGEVDPGFERRMFVYNYRIFDTYDRPVASLAVLADDDPTWRPDRFEYERLGCRHSLHFPVAKLVDYIADEESLLANPSPFALITAAHLYTRRTRKSPARRFDAKRRLVRLLYQRNWSRQRIIDLFRVLDWILKLPDSLERQLWQDIENIEGERNVTYVSSIERFAIERGMKKGMQQGIEQGIEQGIQQGIEKGIARGIEKGIQQGLAQSLQRQLNRRFGPLSAEVTLQLENATPEQLETWTDRVLDARTIEEVFAEG
ncbi:Rpn family recombination-promoting nuclease/putative transposase [Thauera sp. ZXT1-4]|uniref:Rpn family recombination-promoting nuclease/putative transposase n=1 Tax=Thauera sp. ZXT1-4 TaxID=3460294 RepID=UPI004040B7E3